ncbi:DUF4397 domain-containing protein [Romboutsia sp.]|uniref:DUF4397 domain-containing protein n=1 Tax=Romboutsia sp. TaxID=1965302 RepID=UPI002BA732B0|nr:DUF4397 domain-containing protein [Romboutsia sp.]HSQ87258.1 DUF4397 domain-containing protein [Romboutsia sp.]
MRNFKENYSLVRILHAVPYGEEVDVYINGFPFYNDIRFAQFTPYIYVPEGEHIFSVYVKDEKDKPLAEAKVQVNSDELITMPIILNESGLELLPIPEEMEAPSGTQSKFKFVHLVPELPPVNILMDGERIFTNVKYKDYTEYKEMQPKEYKMDIEIPENNKVFISNKANINPGRIYTFYAIGAAPNIDIIQTLDGATFLS